MDTSKYVSLHWDSKLLGSSLDKTVNEERFAAAIEDVNEIKFLGVSADHSGTSKHSGDIVTEKSMELLKLWDRLQLVVQMVFDATAPNTRNVTAACDSLQQALAWRPQEGGKTGICPPPWKR